MESTLVADSEGFCLQSTGDAPSNGAGALRAIAQNAASLGSGTNAPVIRIETDTQEILIQDNGAQTIAVYRSQQSGQTQQ
mmetsp:Transcript_18788/g.37679  ORF Transcript_18788/g.37679 Transcript_18788/m.37679 type:complete len:80 (-) Transcript_18788:47-286(-)